jgi:hypothetical protein
VLVRPDGFVGWRAHNDAAASEAAIDSVVDALLLRRRDASGEAAPVPTATSS